MNSGFLFPKDSEFSGDADGPFVPPAWVNICDSFIDPLAAEIETWLREFPDCHCSDEEICEYIREFNFLLCAIADDIGSQSAEYLWRKARLWLEVNVSVEFCSKFEATVREVREGVAGAESQYLGTEAIFRDVVLKELTYILVPSFLDFLIDLSATLRPRLVPGTLGVEPMLAPSQNSPAVPLYTVDLKLSQVRYRGKLYNVTDSQALVLSELIKARDWVSLSSRGISKPSEVMKSLPHELKSILASSSGKGWRIRPEALAPR